MGSIEMNTTVWEGHEDQILQLFSLYREKVDKLISLYDTLKNKFPVGVINELRDIFSHLTQSLEVNDPLQVDRHLDKALRHMKRAVVDAFKYAVMAYMDECDRFRHTYRNVDLSLINNGNFLPELTRLDAHAKTLMLDAKALESDSTHSEDQLYSAYEEAYNAHKALYEYVIHSQEGAEALKLRGNKRFERFFSVGGFVVGIVGIIIGIVVAIIF